MHLRVVRPSVHQVFAWYRFLLPAARTTLYLHPQIIFYIIGLTLTRRRNYHPFYSFRSKISQKQGVTNYSND